MAGLQQQVAIVTGAGSGIGRAIAKALGTAGATVCLVGRTPAKLEAVASEIGDSARAYPADLTSEEAITALLNQVNRERGRLDILVHSAGTIANGKVEHADVADLDAQFSANVRAPFLLTQKLLPMLKVARGQVVFINSSAGLSARLSSGAYSATQHANKAIADSLRAEVNEYGIRVLNVFPGRTATPRQEMLYRNSGSTYRPELLMQPEDVAQMVVAALSLPKTAEVTEISMRPLLKSY